MAKNLRIDFTTSMLFEYSKVQKDEFTEHVSSKGNTSFRKYYRQGITGSLESVEIRDSKFGQNLQLVFKEDNGELVYTQVNLYDQRGEVDNAFAEPIIRLVENLEKGVIYKVVPYNLSAEDQKSYDETTEGREVKQKYYDRRGVSVKLEDGTKIKDTLTYGDNGNIPSIVWKEHPSSPGKKKPSAASLEEKTEFLVATLKSAIDNGLAYKSTSTNSAPKQETTPEMATAGADANEEHDDLPF